MLLLKIHFDLIPNVIMVSDLLLISLFCKYEIMRKGIYWLDF